jgi:hypothetical protein
VVQATVDEVTAAEIAERNNRISESHIHHKVFREQIVCIDHDSVIAFPKADGTWRQRARIRRRAGAYVGFGLLDLISKDFLKLVIIAFIIASPLAWYFMNSWLQDYVYRINISWWLFAAGGLAAIIIAFATISYQAIKAAVANPVKSLRTE